ncbi:MAG: LacI family DNA-binding transcriptional regulator [Acidobacteriaceae bacterium]|nr:LacI family DNA-binding transcriptional regulator [Acidobacteriaceae bacterium]
MAISIKDIARIAGVSHSTVSRALHNSPLLPAPTRERIQRIAREHGYAASAIARSLVTRKTHAIGVVVTSIADPFNGEVVGGIEEVANNAGYSVILATSQAQPEREMSVVRSFQERRVDGILVASSRVGALNVEHLADLKIPIVLLNNQHPGDFVHSITIDNVDGAEQATRHLAVLGHTNIAYLGDRFGMQSDAERYEGYRAGLLASGIRLRKAYVVRGDGKPAGAREAAAELLNLGQPPSAIVCYNDMSALGVLDEARRRRIEIPRELSICGFDDLFFTPFLRPPLTTVHQPKSEIGRQAMQLLLLLLSGQKQNKTLKVKGELIVRGSTAAPKGQ